MGTLCLLFFFRSPWRCRESLHDVVMSPFCLSNVLPVHLAVWRGLSGNKQMLQDWEGHQTSYLLYFPAGFQFRFLSASYSWTFCLHLLCFEDHALYLHLNILYFAHLKPKFFPLPPAFTPDYIYIVPNIYAIFMLICVTIKQKKIKPYKCKQEILRDTIAFLSTLIFFFCK